MQVPYREFCNNHTIPIYHQPWWLDAVCGKDHWSVCLSTDRGGAITGILPYYIRRRWGLKMIQQPPLTTYAGPIFCYPEQENLKLYSRYTFEKKVLSALIAQLPKVVFFQQHFRPDITNWLAFQQAGYRQTTRYTYTLDTKNTLKNILEGVKSGTRTNLKKAAKNAVFAVESDQAGLVFDFYAASMRQKGLRLPCEKSVFMQLDGALLQRQQVACFIARNREDQIPQGGLYLVLDGQRAGILLSGVASDHRHLAIMQGLIWAAVEFCHLRKLVLDFEGSMDPGVEHLYRSFGAEMVPYFRVWKWRLL